MMSRAIGIGLVVALGGCVTIYQPMRGLHAPRLIDLEAENFTKLKVFVHCIPGEFIKAGHARLLCDAVKRSLENQGASVLTIAKKGVYDEDFQDAGDGGETFVPDLRVSLSTRLVHKHNNALLWTLNVLTLTLVPGTSEYTFAQEVTIRDGSGTILISDELQGRLVRYTGLGGLIGNSLANIARKKKHKLGGRHTPRHLSEDLYGSVSQLLFNANIRREILLGSSYKRGGL